jgi:hypothetical protein
LTPSTKAFASAINISGIENNFPFDLSGWELLKTDIILVFANDHCYENTQDKYPISCSSICLLNDSMS